MPIVQSWVYCPYFTDKETDSEKLRHCPSHRADNEGLMALSTGGSSFISKLTLLSMPQLLSFIVAVERKMTDWLNE